MREVKLEAVSSKVPTIDGDRDGAHPCGMTAGSWMPTGRRGVSAAVLILWSADETGIVTRGHQHLAAQRCNSQ